MDASGERAEGRVEIAAGYRRVPLLISKISVSRKRDQRLPARFMASRLLIRLTLRPSSGGETRPG